MSADESYVEGNDTVAERVAFGVAVLLFVVSLVTKAVRWDWLLDTMFLVAAGYLALHRSVSASGSGKTRQFHTLLLAVYLLLDSSFMLLVGLTFVGWWTLVAAVYTGCYAVSVRARLRQAGLSLHTPMGALLQGRALPVTLGAAVPLLCLFLPMLHAHYDFKAWSGPMVVYLPGTTHMNAGHTVEFRGDVLTRGIGIAFSRVAGLLLLGALAAHLAHLQGWLASKAVQRYLRIAAVLVALWWLTVAHGLRSLRQPADLLFAVGLGLLVVSVFRRTSQPPA